MRLLPCLATCLFLAGVCRSQEQRPPPPIADGGITSSRLARDSASAKAPLSAPGNGSAPVGDPAGTAAPVPEPSALFLVGTGLLGVAITSRLRRRGRPQADS